MSVSNLPSVDVAATLWDKHGYEVDPMETGSNGKACLVAILAAESGVDIQYDEVYISVQDSYGLTSKEVAHIEEGFMGLTTLSYTDVDSPEFKYGQAVAERLGV